MHPKILPEGQGDLGQSGLGVPVMSIFSLALSCFTSFLSPKADSHLQFTLLSLNSSLST